jgi:hypothetical protein
MIAPSIPIFPGGFGGGFWLVIFGPFCLNLMEAGAAGV